MEMVKQSIQYARAAMKFSSQAMAEGELTPPPSLPPIAQMLAIDGRAGASAEAMEDRILIDGMVTLSVLYVCESGKVHGFESIAMFKHNVDVPGVTQQTRCRVSPCVSEISHHLSNGALHVRSQIKLDCLCEENAEIEAVAKVDDAETRSILFQANKKSIVKEETSLREDIRLPRSADRLLGINGFSRIQDIASEGDQVNVEGVLRVNLMFITPDGTLMQTPASFPFSQRIAIAPQAGNPSAHARILMLTAVLVDEDIATVDAQFEIMLTTETQHEYEMLSDAYAAGSEIECIRECIPICESKSLSSRCTLRQTVAIPNHLPPADRVLITLLRPSVENAIPREGTIDLTGTLHACIIYLDREGNIRGFESQLPFACEGEADGLKPHMEVSLDLSCELVHAGASGMEISLQSALDVSMEATECKDLYLVTGMEEKERESPPRGLLVYFPDENEGLWEIGKRFGIGMDALRELNPDIGENPQSIILNMR